MNHRKMIFEFYRLAIVLNLMRDNRFSLPDIIRSKHVSNPLHFSQNEEMIGWMLLLDMLIYFESLEVLSMIRAQLLHFDYII